MPPVDSTHAGALASKMVVSASHCCLLQRLFCLAVWQMLRVVRCMETRVACELQVPDRLLMGPGPSNAHPTVLATQSLPLLGHMHPPFLKIMVRAGGRLLQAAG